jgi:hypothetical protein
MQHFHRWQGFAVVPKVVHQRRFQRSVGEFIHAKGAEKRASANSLDQIDSSHKQAALGPSEEFVSAGRDEVSAKAKAVDPRRLRLNPQVMQGVKQASALVIE